MRAREEGPGIVALPLLSALGPLLVLYLKEADFVSLYACYLFPANLCRLLAQLVSRLLRGTHRFFTLPEGDAKSLATLAVSECDHAFEAVHLLGPWQDLISG